MNKENVFISIIIPCKNERGNILPIVQRMPQVSAVQELLFVEGNSTDGTYEEIVRVQQEYPDKNIRVFKQPGKGKREAVWFGFYQAQGEMLVIFDGDLTIAPEDLVDACKMLTQQKADFINGNRFFYENDAQAMPFMHWLANRLIALTFTIVFFQPVRDTLCGTKILWKRDFLLFDQLTKKFIKNTDPFGDFELLFGAHGIKSRIVDYPFKYFPRTYGVRQVAHYRAFWTLIHVGIRGLCMSIFCRAKLLGSKWPKISWRLEK